MLEYVFLSFFFAYASLTLLYLVRLMRIEAGALPAALLKVARPARPPPAITYVRPMKGVDAGTEACIRSLYLAHTVGQRHASVIYSFESRDDPAVALVQRLASEYADRMETRMVIASLAAHNPKMANCVEAYEQATTEWVALFDSNVECTPGYVDQLERYCVPTVKAASGCVHGVLGSDDLSARLEFATLYTFCGKGMLLADTFGQSPLFGKAMLVHKPTLDSIGGLRRYKDTFSEDGEIGMELARRYGPSAVPVMHVDTPQRLVATSIEALIARFSRWALYRKLRVPLLFWTEPLLYPLSSTLLAALACGSWIGAAGLAAVHAALVAVEAHYAHTAQARTAPVQLSYAECLFSIVASNMLLLPIWAQAAAARSVCWKGRNYSVNPKTGNMEIVVYYGK